LATIAAGDPPEGKDGEAAPAARQKDKALCSLRTADDGQRKAEQEAG